MISVAQEDVLRGLKKCKRLAKQAILASYLTPDPSFWTAQAEARRATYDELMVSVERSGVEPAYQGALSEYRSLTSAAPVPAAAGRRQALEMFFRILGIDQVSDNPVSLETSLVEPGTSAQGSFS